MNAMDPVKSREHVCRGSRSPRAILGGWGAFSHPGEPQLAELLLFRTWNVSRFSANTNEALYKMLLFFSLSDYFLGYFQGVE